MQSIKSLIQELNTKAQEKIFNAFKILDSNDQELLNRIKALELRNLKYFVRATRTAALVSATGAAIPFDTKVYPQFGNMHDVTNNNDKVYIRREGVYEIHGGIHYGINAGGVFRQADLILTRNGVPINIAIQKVTNGNTVIILNPGCSYYCYVDDYIQLITTHDLGGDVVIGPFSQTFISVSERREDLDPSQYGLLNPEANIR